jgi:hypothetical protein
VVPGSAPAKDWTNIHFSSPTRSADVPLGVRYGTVKLGCRAPPNADFRFASERRYPKDRHFVAGQRVRKSKQAAPVTPSQCPLRVNFRTSAQTRPMSALPSIADIRQAGRFVRFVPEPDSVKIEFDRWRD